MIPFVLEQLSISMEEGVVSRWLVADGSAVRKGDVVVEIETDKSTVDVETPADGVLRIRVQAGAIVPVNTVLAELVSPGEGEDATPSPLLPSPIAAPSPLAATAAAESAPPNRADHIASPAARRIARETGVEVSTLVGSGPAGRILANDVQRAAAAACPPTPPRPAAGALRDLVVESINQSWRTIPHIHIAGDLHADGLARARTIAPKGTTVTDLLLFAVAQALGDVPDLNGTFHEHDGVRRSAHVNLGLAVATPDGIVAPVIHDVGGLSLTQVATERARLVAAARAGSLQKRDLGGATCTVSNLGAYPVDFFAPVISGPQIALVATGRLTERPVAIGGMLAVRHRIWVNVAIDHRAADGEAGGRFLAALGRVLEGLPDRLVTEEDEQ